MSLTPLPQFLPRKVHLWGMNGPLPTELKFRENTVPFSSGDYRDLELVSSLARVCNSGSLFQSNYDVYEIG